MQTMLYNFPGNKLLSSRLSIIYAQGNQKKGKKEKSQIFVIKILSTHKKARTNYVCACACSGLRLTSGSSSVTMNVCVHVFRPEADIRGLPQLLFTICIKKVSLN